jgi:perosamine synthetase
MKIPLCLPSIDKKELKISNKILKSKWLTSGKYNLDFEKKFSKYIGCKYALSLNSCTSALELAVKVNGLKKNDEVIVPSFTWVSSINAIINAGAKPVLCDSDIKTKNVTAEYIEKKITKKTKAVMIVHYGGQICDMGKILKLIKKYKLILIEDSAETIGSRWNNKMCGSFGIGCFSFFPTKNITTGEGGMLTTNSKKFYNQCKLYIAHGITKSTYQREKLDKPWQKIAALPGHNFRMSNLLAGIGLVQLSKINELNKKRCQIAKIYDENFRLFKDKIITPKTVKGINHVYQTYSILVNKKIREKLLIYLNKMGIGATVHFTPALHEQKIYKKYQHGSKLPNAKLLSDCSVSLPIYPDMKKKDADYVSNKVINFFNKVK